MRKYKVWSETYDQNEDDGLEIEADTPQLAAQAWALWSDDRRDYYRIVNGDPAEATVKSLDTGHVSHWFVHGEAVPVYTAKLRVGDGATT